jgi:hypothetical protein
MKKKVLRTKKTKRRKRNTEKKKVPRKKEQNSGFLKTLSILESTITLD